MISKNSLLQIAELQSKICSIDERLDFIRNCIQQLLFDNCDVCLSFKMHNRDTQQKNDLELEVSGYQTALELAEAFKIPITLITVKKPVQKDPSPQFSTTFSEANAVLVLNTFYEQELTLQKGYQLQLAELLRELHPVEENPVTLLNKHF